MFDGVNVIVIIFDVFKGLFVIGVCYGEGVVLICNLDGKWSVFVFVLVIGGNFGW